MTLLVWMPFVVLVFITDWSNGKKMRTHKSTRLISTEQPTTIMEQKKLCYKKNKSANKRCTHSSTDKTYQHHSLPVISQKQKSQGRMKNSTLVI